MESALSSARITVVTTTQQKRAKYVLNIITGWELNKLPPWIYSLFPVLLETRELHMQRLRSLRVYTVLIILVAVAQYASGQVWKQDQRSWFSYYEPNIPRGMDRTLVYDTCHREVWAILGPRVFGKVIVTAFRGNTSQSRITRIYGPCHDY